MKASILALALAAIGTAGAQAQTNGFSVVIASDPQFTWWRGGADKDCTSADCEKQRTQTYNTSLTQSMATAGSLVWPQELPRGGGSTVLSPSAAIINGDLTATWQREEADLYKQYFPGALHIPLFAGLGNHDYANYVGKCYFGGAVDKNLCAKQAVWYMAGQVDHELPLLVNRDLSGYVTLTNNAFVNARLSVSWLFEGVRSSKTTDVIPGAGGKKSVILPPSATDIDVNIEWNNGLSWNSAQHYQLARGKAACYSLGGSLFGQSTSTESCPAEWPTGSYGSMSYSFDMGKYHFVQLQLEPGYEVELPEVGGLIPYPGFSVKNSWAWLKNDLKAATAAGKYSVLNMHAFGEKLDYSTDMTALQDALRGNTVVAIFSGHIHEDFGRMAQTVTVDDSPVSVVDRLGKLGVPTFRSGSGECSRFLVAEFHDDYFNVGVAAANNLTPSWTGDVCDSRPVMEEVTVDGVKTNQVWGYARNNGDPAPMQFTLQRNLKVTMTAAGAPASGPVGAASGRIDYGAGPISLTVDWGDGSRLQDTSVYNNPPLPAQFNVSHLYAKDGRYTVSLLATDGTGAIGSATSTLTADATPPVTTAQVTPSGTGSLVTLTATDNLSTVTMTRYRLDNGAPATYAAPFLAPAGTNAVYFWSVDSLENVETPKSIQVGPDKTPPVTKATAPPANANGWYRTSPVPVTLTATDTGSGVKLMAIGVDGSFMVPITEPFPVSGDGKHQVPYYSVDNAGNVETMRSLPVWIDTKPPVMTVNSPTQTLKNTSPYFWLELPPVPVEIKGTLMDALSGIQSGSVQYTVKDSYGSYQPAGWGNNSPDGTFSVSVPLVPTLAFQPRVYTVTITASDMAGNPVSVTVTITVTL